MLEEVTKSVAFEFHRLHGEIIVRDARIRRLLDLLQASYALGKGSDSIIGLDSCDDFKDYVAGLEQMFNGQIHQG